MKKQVLAGALAASIAAVAIAGASLAYFTATDNEKNVFTSGNVQIDLTEPNWEAEGEAEAQGMYPGESVKKDPTVENTGANPALVRVKVEGLEENNLTYRTGYQDGKLGEGWVDGNDGYFYYTKVLAGSTTPASDVEKYGLTTTTTKLFEQVHLDIAATATDNEFTVDVTAEAVQAQGVFPSFETVANGIDESEMQTVKDFFNAAFSAQA